MRNILILVLTTTWIALTPKAIDAGYNYLENFETPKEANEINSIKKANENNIELIELGINESMENKFLELMSKLPD